MSNCNRQLRKSHQMTLTQKAHGHPWLKDTGLTHLIHQTAATPAVPTNVTVLYPNFDYTTFG